MPIEEPTYPINLVVSGRRCLVVGGGAVAARKARGLLAAGAHVVLVAREVSPDARGLSGSSDVSASSGGPSAGQHGALRLSIEERPYRRGEVDGYWLAVVATDDPAVNQAVREDGDAAGVWVNAADDPENCSFTLPAISRRGPITVTVSTGGSSPALASWLREHVDGELGPEYVELAEMLSEARERFRSAGRSTEEADWRQVVDSEMLELLRKGQKRRAKERLEAWLSSSLV